MGGRKGLVKGQALTMKDDSFDTKLVLQVLKEVKRGISTCDCRMNGRAPVGKLPTR